MSQNHSGRSLAICDRILIFQELNIPCLLTTFAFNSDILNVFDQQNINLELTSNMYLSLIFDIQNLSELQNPDTKWSENSHQTSTGILVFSDLLNQSGELLSRSYYANTESNIRYKFRTDYFGKNQKLRLQEFYDENEILLSARYWDNQEWLVFQTKSELITYYLNKLIGDQSTILYSDAVNEEEQAIYNTLANKYIIGRVNILHAEHLTQYQTIRPGYRNMLLSKNSNTWYVCGTQRQVYDLKQLGLTNSLNIPPISGTTESTINTSQTANDFLVLVSRIDPVKRVEDAITAVTLAHKVNPNISFEIWGQPEDAQYQKKLDELITTSMANEFIKFMGPTTRPIEVFQRANLALVCSKEEGFARTITESLSAGTPLVGYQTEYGPKEMIIDSKTGISVPDGDTDALSQAILSGLKQFSNEKSRCNAAHWVNTYAGRSVIANKWNNLVKRVNSNA
ncbi:glycosyltransferase [Pediococcus argentinicus]|nr:glycosyltransferase [Pediococcus argentinicus]